MALPIDPFAQLDPFGPPPPPAQLTPPPQDPTGPFFGPAPQPTFAEDFNAPPPRTPPPGGWPDLSDPANQQPMFPDPSTFADPSRPLFGEQFAPPPPPPAAPRSIEGMRPQLPAAFSLPRTLPNSSTLGTPSRGPSAPGALSGFRPQMPAWFRGLMRSPYAQFAGGMLGQLGLPRFQLPAIPFLEEDEWSRRRDEEGQGPPAWAIGG
jgi:hypothetical protein